MDKETAGVIKKAVDQTVEQLKRENMIVKAEKTPYQKTEYLLYNYQNFKAAIKEKDDKIVDIETNGLPGTSRSITQYGGSGTKEYEIMEQEAIDSINRSIARTRKSIDLIERALKHIKGDKYYLIIESIYFQGKTLEETAQEIEKSIPTVARNRKRLINKLKIQLFSDDVIKELLENEKNA